MTKKGLTQQDYNTPVLPTWCPGCGDHIIKSALAQALVQMNIAPHEVAMTFDIGCISNGADKINGYVFKSLHGRSVPAGVGIKYANKDLPVISIIGDGGNYDEGLAHFVSSAQRNEDITVLVANNQIYGLTTGQTTATTECGYKTVSYPDGSPDKPINPIQLAISSGATFVARAFTGDMPHLVEMIKKAINHKGFAVLDILQTCVTWNKLNTLEYYKERVYKLGEKKGYDPIDKISAIKEAEIGDGSKFGIGIFYQIEGEPVNEDKYKVLQGKPIAHRDSKPRDISDFLKNHS